MAESDTERVLFSLSKAADIGQGKSAGFVPCEIRLFREY